MTDRTSNPQCKHFPHLGPYEPCDKCENERLQAELSILQDVHAVALDEIEKYKAWAASADPLLPVETFCEPTFQTPQFAGLAFRHWGKDPAVPYVGCRCDTCSSVEPSVGRGSTCFADDIAPGGWACPPEKAGARCDWGCHVRWSGWPASHHPNCTVNGEPREPTAFQDFVASLPENGTTVISENNDGR